MHGASTTTMRLQVTIPAATYGPSAAVPMQMVCPIDLLASSCCSVFVAVVGKAIKIWAARRQFGGVDNSRFAALPIFTTCAFRVLAEFGYSAAALDISSVLLVRGTLGFGCKREGGAKKCPWWWL